MNPFLSRQRWRLCLCTQNACGVIVEISLDFLLAGFYRSLNHLGRSRKSDRFTSVHPGSPCRSADLHKLFSAQTSAYRWAGISHLSVYATGFSHVLSVFPTCFRRQLSGFSGSFRLFCPFFQHSFLSPRLTAFSSRHKKSRPQAALILHSLPGNFSATGISSSRSNTSLMPPASFCQCRPSARPSTCGSPCRPSMTI